MAGEASGNSNWASVASAGVQAAGGLFGSIISGEYNKQLAKLQNEFNLEMWNRVNEYNHPQAQMQRFEEAGLNPNLIYGQGSAGNATSAPEMVAPKAPNIEGAAQKIAEAFNVQNLMLMDAKRREAQANARIAQLNQFDKEDEREAAANFGDLYSYDPKTGRYVWSPADVTSYASNPRGSRPGDRPITGYVFNQSLMNGDRNWLIPYRAALLEHQRDYLAPQITMANYEARMYPYSFWIGQGARALSGIGSVIPKMSLKLGGSRGSYTAPGGRQYYY